MYSGLIYSEILHNRSAWAFFNSSLLRASQEGGGGRGACSLVPYKNSQLFPCSSKINQGVPRNSLLLSSHLPRNCAPCSLDHQKYSSRFPTISVIFHLHFRLLERGYPVTNLRKYLSEIKFAHRKTVLQQKNKAAGKKLLPFIT